MNKIMNFIDEENRVIKVYLKAEYKDNVLNLWLINAADSKFYREITTDKIEVNYWNYNYIEDKDSICNFIENYELGYSTSELVIDDEDNKEYLLCGFYVENIEKYCEIESGDIYDIN